MGSSADVPGPLHHIGKLLLRIIDEAIENRWEHAQRVAALAAGTVDERVRKLTRAFAREMATVGAITGGTAAIPGAGAVTFIATTVAELGWFTARAADLILTIAAVHGHSVATVEQRRMWILSVLALGDGAHAGIAKLAGEAGKGLGARATAEIPIEALRIFNQQMGRTIITKYGTKRGVIALGEAFPFGIGAAIGGGANNVSARAIANRANSFFKLLAPSVPA